MERVTLIDNEFATLWYYPEAKIVHHKLHKPTHGEDFRAVLVRGVEVLERELATKWLSDDRENGPLTEEDTQWGMHVWSPRVLRAGWKFWAIVMPDVAIGRVNMKRFISLYMYQGVKVRLFESPEEALAWLGDPSKIEPDEAGEE